MSAALAGLFCLAGPARAEWVWDSETGWIDLSASPERSARGLYAYARGLMIRGDFAAAEEVHRQVEREFVTSPWAERAMLGRAQCLERLGRLREALALDEALLKREKKAVRLEEVAAHQLKTLKKLAAVDPRAAIGPLAEAVRAAPDRSLRAEALRALADTRYDCEEYDDARKTYEKLSVEAEDEKARNDAVFRAALADLAFCRKEGHDPERLRRSATAFRRYVESVGEGADADKARLYLWVIDNVQRETDPLRRPVYYAVTYLPEGRYDEAQPILKRSADKFAGSRAGETGSFFQAECLYLQGEYWDAFKAYEKFLKEYPATVRFRDAVAREFAAGKALKEKGSLSKALVVFERVVDNIPGGPLADDALMYEGYCYLADERYADARISFDQVVSGYAQSEWYYAAVFNAGKADLLGSEFSNDKTEMLSRARRSFDVYLKRRPSGPFAREAQRLLETCLKKQAGELTKVARFYERRNQPLAAAMYYRAVVRVREHPKSAAAKAAQERLAQYEQEGLKLP